MLQAIEAMRAEFLAKIDEKTEMQNDLMRKQISMLREEMKAATEQANLRVNMLDERTTSLEVAANTHSDAITDMERQVGELRKEVDALKAKAEDLEGRSRRCNLRIFGIKENRETGAKPSTFIEVLKLNTAPLIDRAHRTLQRAPGKDQPPRAFVIKCHYYQERETILQKALASQRLVSQDGDVLKVFPDYTQAVARQRAAFGQARRLLRQCEGVKFGLLYPARMIVATSTGEEGIFTDPAEATAFAKGLMGTWFGLSVTTLGRWACTVIDFGRFVFIGCTYCRFLDVEFGLQLHLLFWCCSLETWCRWHCFLHFLGVFLGVILS